MNYAEVKKITMLLIFMSGITEQDNTEPDMFREVGCH